MIEKKKLNTEKNEMPLYAVNHYRSQVQRHIESHGQWACAVLAGLFISCFASCRFLIFSQAT